MRIGEVRLVLALACALVCSEALGADLEATREMFLRGEYQECIRISERETRERYGGEEWRLLHVESLLATGQYLQASNAVETALDRAPWSMRTRELAWKVFQFNGDVDRAYAVLAQANRQLSGRRSRWAPSDSRDLVALGKLALRAGADPRRVLDFMYEPAQKADQKAREVPLAIGELALEKHDYDLAAKTFSEALKQFPKDADMHYGLAAAHAPSDRRQMLAELEAALKANEKHVPSLLLLADHLVDGEDYVEAEKQLTKALAVNPWHPEGWAYRAVLAHLEGDQTSEDQARARGLKYWTNNPAVDHLIGRKLSQKYRFAEGAEYQRRALAFDARYVPAKVQLTQDLLRLGNEEEGWKLADEVSREDGYDVTAYNLVTLRGTLQKFTTLTNGHFIVRMEPREAAVYGQQVLSLLDRAKARLEPKYGLQLKQPTVVEIFNNPKDFGVRTFGMPDNPGYLGVCFGPVITANSPAAQAGHAANWQAVLWHEFCHVITLGLTGNKLPRWLSEGISVYEERLENPTWGQHMNPNYRELVLGDDLVPPGDLSAAFLAPPSNLHLQFAYYEASLVVEFVVERFGLGALKQVLAEVNQGKPINRALAKHTLVMEKFEKAFSEFARAKAKALAPGLDWTKKDSRGAGAGSRWDPARINNYYDLMRESARLMKEKKWTEATKPLETLVRLYPGQTGPDNALSMLAQAYRELEKTDAEREILARLAAQDADALTAFARLMEIGTAAQDWGMVLTNAQRYLAVNPMVPQPHRNLAKAAEAVDDGDAAITAYQAMLALDPPDPAEVHYKLARLLFQRGDPAAKRHVLKALEEAPRYRDAQRLLLEITAPRSTQASPAPASVSKLARKVEQ